MEKLLVPLGRYWIKRRKLPVNIYGGLKAKGHPVGTTGVSMAYWLLDNY